VGKVGRCKFRVLRRCLRVFCDEKHLAATEKAGSA